MQQVKDLFSKQAGNYAAYRPTYSDQLYRFLYSITKQFGQVWDCATGNGQVANRLADRFTHVQATDISNEQISRATQKDNISYSVQRAEATIFPDNSFDLITVGTAVHWFDFDAFYKEVKRVGKPGAHLAVWTYAPFRSNTGIDAITDEFAYETLHGYWDEERKYVDEHYRNIPFPFEEIATPQLNIKVDWSYEHMMGYLNSWSAVQHYIKREQTNPVDLIEEKLKGLWKPGEAKHLTIPLYMRAGVIK